MASADSPGSPHRDTRPPSPAPAGEQGRAHDPLVTTGSLRQVLTRQRSLQG